MRCAYPPRTSEYKVGPRVSRKIGYSRTNVASLDAERWLSESTSSLVESFQRLSSGLRINKPSDDAAGLSISELLNVDGRIYSQGVKNVNDGISVFSIADSSLEQLSSIVTRIRELATESANGTYSNKQRAALDKEGQALAKEFNRIARTTSFNGINLFDAGQGDITLQTGYSQLTANLGGAIGDGTFKPRQAFGVGSLPVSVAVGDFNGDGVADLASADFSVNTVSVLLGNGDGTFRPRQTFTTGARPFSVVVGDFNGDGVVDLVSTDEFNNTVSLLLGNSFHGVSALQSFSLATRDSARSAMTYFAQVQTRVSAQRGVIGSFESRAGYAVNSLASAFEELKAASGRITDVDVADESANLVKNRILQKAGAAVLAQANQAPALVLLRVA